MKLALRKFVAPAAVAAAFVVVAAQTSPVLAQGDAQRMNRSDARFFVTGSDPESLLVHSTAPTHNTVCSSAHGSGDVTVKYDDNTTTLSLGHCALLAAGHVSVHGAHEATNAHVSVHNYHHSHAP